MKYAAIALLFLFNSEIVSLLALSMMMLAFGADCMKERIDRDA